MNKTMGKRKAIFLGNGFTRALVKNVPTWGQLIGCFNSSDAVQQTIPYTFQYEMTVCQRTPSSSSATAVRGFKNPKIFPKSLQAKAFPRPVCKLFQIHGSKFKPHPLRNAGQASHVGIAHREIGRAHV